MSVNLVPAIRPFLKVVELLPVRVDAAGDDDHVARFAAVWV